MATQLTTFDRLVAAEALAASNLDRVLGLLGTSRLYDDDLLDVIRTARADALSVIARRRQTLREQQERERLEEEEEQTLGPVVQVRFPGSLGQYCYRDPSRSLRPGDLVLVPVAGAPTLRLARVVELGRGAWVRPVTKQVSSRLVEVPFTDDIVGTNASDLRVFSQERQP